MLKRPVLLLAFLSCAPLFSAGQEQSDVVLEELSWEVSNHYSALFNGTMRPTPVAFIMEDMDEPRNKEVENRVKMRLGQFLIQRSRAADPRQFQLVERDRTDRAWEAQKRGCSGEVSTACAIALGSDLAASSLIVGKISQDGPSDPYMIQVRIISVENGEVEASFIDRFVVTKASSRSGSEPSLGADATGTTSPAKKSVQPRRWRAGPRLGVGMATITAGGFLSWNGLPKVGPLGGWSFELPWTEQTSFLFEPMYITKGSLANNPQMRTWTSTRLGYIELPVLAKISLQKDPGGIYMAGGFAAGMWMNGRYKVTQAGTTMADIKYIVRGTRNRMQASVALGMGWDIGASAFEIRVQQSITPFSTVIRGQNMVVGLHYTFYFPKKAAARRG
ncbi:MAG: PorT family protein [Flavobacteriales bacterium]|nr:PorT family protein [Flavobacteriales bacterium]